MILFVLSIAVMNFGLGYALAVALSDAPLISPAIWRRLRESAAGIDEEAVPLLPPVSLADIPQPWLDQLADAQLPPKDYLQALLLKLWLDIVPIREELLTAEVRGKLELSRLDQAAAAQLLADVRGLHGRWRRSLGEVYELLELRFDGLEADSAAGEDLEQLLEQSLSGLDRSCPELDALSHEKEPELAARQLLTLLRDWIELLHRHRDSLQELLAAQLRGGSELNGLGQPLYLDPLTGQISRLGMENLFELWFRDDPQRLRLVSCALVEIDRFGRLNDRLGHRAGDRLLNVIAGLLADGIRTDRGFDRLGRHSGNQFLIFFGDTGPRNAAIAVERIRQALEAVTLDYEGNEHDVTISAGIAAISRDDTLDKFYKRLRRSLQMAQKDGRNRTSIDDGDGPQTLFEPQRFPVRANRVRVEAN